MKILAFETSGEAGSVALRCGLETHSLVLETGPAQSATVLQRVSKLLADASCRVGDLDGIAFSAGPGAFTGLRLGCGLAQGLAMGAGIGVVPVGTLDALAAQVVDGIVVAAIDARMGELYWAGFHCLGGMPVANWLELGLPAFDAPDVAIASGSILYRPGSTITFFTRATGEVRGQAHPTFSWTNTFYRRSVFLEMGGSDESLCYSQFGNAAVDCGDTDLAWRILEAGHRSAFVSDATVYTQLENLPPQKWLLELSRMFVVPALFTVVWRLARRA